AAKLLDPARRTNIKQLQEDEFLAAFLKACVLIQLGQGNSGRELFEKIRKKYPPRFDQNWTLNFSAFPPQVQAILANIVTRGMTPQQIMAKGTQLYKARSQGSMLYFYQLRKDPGALVPLCYSRALCGDFANAAKDMTPYLDESEYCYFLGYLFFKIRDYPQSYKYWKRLETKLGKNVSYLIVKKFGDK
ncbi:MAG: Mpv17/PMP22 family protein, partial [Planctomycetota bacterium]|nr:Mpv17/PMP22 family protein [Planctomycetota bacterium]